MERKEFKAFAARALEEVVQLAESHLAKKLPRPPRFQWFGQTPTETDDVAEVLVDKIYSGPKQIRPCVDIGVTALDLSGRPLVVATVSGHQPTEFGKNWTGREGPFVYFLGGLLLNGEPADSIPVGKAFNFRIVHSK